MMQKRQPMEGKFFLKVPGKRQYFKLAGSSDNGNGETVPCAQTTNNIYESFGFTSEKSAEAMRRVLDAKYGLHTQVVKWEVHRKQ